MWSCLSSGHGEAASGLIVAGRRFLWSSWLVVSNVSLSMFTVRLICAGWLPQGEVFELEVVPRV
jgi:hypothetical protein